MCNGCSKECQAFCHCSLRYMIRQGCKPPLDQAIRCHQGIMRVMLNVQDFYRQIYFETVGTAANCIVEHFNQKDYTMYASCEQVLLKGTLGELASQNVDQLCVLHIVGL